jgi:hypothetical protein
VPSAGPPFSGNLSEVSVTNGVNFGSIVALSEGVPRVLHREKQNQGREVATAGGDPDAYREAQHGHEDRGRHYLTKLLKVRSWASLLASEGVGVPAGSVARR